MNPINEPQLVPFEVWNIGSLIIEKPHAFEGGEPVVDLTVGCFEAVSEAGKEARGSQEKEKEKGEGTRGCVT